MQINSCSISTEMQGSTNQNEIDNSGHYYSRSRYELVPKNYLARLILSGKNIKITNKDKTEMATPTPFLILLLSSSLIK